VLADRLRGRQLGEVLVHRPAGRLGRLDVRRRDAVLDEPAEDVPDAALPAS
jgi:hypothetical protein